MSCGDPLADPPWQFQNRIGKTAPEHKQLNRYGYRRRVCTTVSTSISLSDAIA